MDMRARHEEGGGRVYMGYTYMSPKILQILHKWKMLKPITTWSASP